MVFTSKLCFEVKTGFFPFHVQILCNFNVSICNKFQLLPLVTLPTPAIARNKNINALVHQVVKKSQTANEK